MSICSAKIAFNEQGTPVASDFDDVYFSNANGLEETRYVFLKNNQLPDRWLSHLHQRFVIAETGFGTGLNFLASLAAFHSFTQENPNARVKRLHFITTEKFPLSRADLEKALQHWPGLSPWSEQLIAQYPDHVGGCHRMVFDDGAAYLDLWLGDIHQTLPSMLNAEKGRVDAWFLDGFAPSKNPDMWTPELFEQMARLSRPEGTFATFTAAGFVKRGLQAAGFQVEKRKGFGHKRDMLAGALLAPPERPGIEPPWHRPASAITEKSKVAIIGGGMAAANLAAVFAERAIKTELFCAADSLADGASGNAQGGFYPQLHVDPSHASLIQAHGFMHARRFYQRIAQSGQTFAHDFCGVLLMGFTDSVAERQHKLLNSGHWPGSLIHGVDEQQASELAGIDIPYSGMFVPDGGWISPPELVNAVGNFAKNKVGSEIHVCHALQALSQSDDRWVLHWQNGHQTLADIVIFATGAQSLNLDRLNALPLRVTRGQVESVPEQPALQGLKTVLCHKGYLTPAHNGSHALGSTYVRQDRDVDYRVEEQAQNLSTLRKALDKCAWAQEVSGCETGRAALRCSMPDHQPAVGRVDDNDGLYVLTALGSRGLTTAPLMAELLVSEILGDPLPLPAKLLDALAPLRQQWREMARQ